MNLAATPRQSMILSGLIQGALMLALHEWFRANGFQPLDLVWVAPAYALAIIAPLSFNFLRGEFAVGPSLRGAAVLAIGVALTAAWFGWSSVAEGGPQQRFGPEMGGSFVFGLASFVVWFVGMPFVQARLRDGRFAFPYERLFDDAWRNTLLLANCIVFTGLFWILLALWAGLFMVLQMGFFKDLFTSRFFVYLATAVAISFAASLEEKEASALRTLRRHLLAFQTRLLPLAALILLLFLGALPVAGLEPVWRTGHATPLMLSLQIVIIALTNAAWQDGSQPAPFSAPVQWLVRAALALLPVLSVLCIWSLSLRVGQHGWSIDRVWAAILVGLCTLYSLGYAANAALRGWLPRLGRVNSGMALLLVGVLLAVHTPLLDPARIATASQVGRLLAGTTEVGKFDFNYLRFSLGRAGDVALKGLAELADRPGAETIRSRAKAALAQQNRYAANEPPVPGPQDIRARLTAYPKGSEIPESFISYLHARLLKQKFNYPLLALKSGAPVPLAALDLGGGPGAELVLMAAPYPVFTEQEGRWRQIGTLNFSAPLPKPEDILRALEAGKLSPAPRQWNDLRLDGRNALLMLNSDASID